MFSTAPSGRACRHRTLASWACRGASRLARILDSRRLELRRHRYLSHPRTENTRSLSEFFRVAGRLPELWAVLSPEGAADGLRAPRLASFPRSLGRDESRRLPSGAFAIGVKERVEVGVRFPCTSLARCESTCRHARPFVCNALCL